ncbi:MAG: hypothetical protein K0M70_04860 [Arenimonas sp.]|uniref:hypothetical protein n=1 Tax=Arenimonas sp. TaxID=1872635 RepID=UPI0025B97BC4|nr:hypothetical protein [Arenimonas sp.]MBW8367173.1 hypothetical protein [Arenimonas sp.]
MPWQNDLRRTSRDAEVAERVIVAVEQLLELDVYLFVNRVGERAISHRLAIYVEAQFPGWDVDCEYDRDGVARKTIPDGTGNDDDEGSAVLPDIIVHHRGPGGNHVVFELKKSSNRLPDIRDLNKLRAYGHHLGYEHGVFIRFVVGEPAPAVSRAEFIYSD